MTKELYTNLIFNVLEIIQPLRPSQLKIKVLAIFLFCSFTLRTTIHAQNLNNTYTTLLNGSIDIVLPKKSVLIKRDYAIEPPILNNVSYRIIKNNLFFASKKSINPLNTSSIEDKLNFSILIASEKYDKIEILNKKIDKKGNSYTFSYKILKRVENKTLFSTEKYWYNNTESINVQIFWDNIDLKKNLVEDILASIKVKN